MAKMVIFTNRLGEDWTVMLEPQAVWYRVPPGERFTVRSDDLELATEIEIEINPEKRQLSVWLDGPAEYPDLEIDVRPTKP